MSEPLLIVGASARAAAQSARRAGYAPWCVDLFADRDLRAVARVKRCPPDRYPEAVLDLVRDAPDAPVLLTGAMENYPEVLHALAATRPPWGASPESIALARDPAMLASMPAIEGLGVCGVRTSAPRHAALTRLLRPKWSSRYWLRKPRRSAGGRGVRFWTVGDAVDAGHYLQQYVAGTPVSAVFAADGWTSRLLGATEQLVGDPAFGAEGYAYVGNLGPLDLNTDQRGALMRLGVGVTQRCDLRGVFGIDLILDAKGVLWPLEVNPRYTASVEVIEAATGVAALRADAAHGADSPRAASLMVGKAVVYARAGGPAPDLYADFSKAEIADVPEPGEPLEAGHPVCTLLASATDRDGCLARLREGARRLYTRLPS